MSDANWISAQEARRRAVEAGFTGNDLIEWARRSQLRTRAKTGVLSSDLSAETDSALDHVRDFPAVPPVDELTLDALGSWPDIPVNFWAEKPTKETWGAGTFASKVYYSCDYNQARMYEYIELHDVTFHEVDLTQLLGACATPPLIGKLPINAKPNDRLYEGRAHRAAELVRSQNIKKAEAFRQVLKDDPLGSHVMEPSQIRALRQAYDSMYDSQGVPRPI